MSTSQTSKLSQAHSTPLTQEERQNKQEKKQQINLLRGWPNPSLLFPAPTLLHSAASSVLSNLSLSTPALLYGADAGDAKLRRQLARWNAGFYQGLESSPPAPALAPPQRGSDISETITNVSDSVGANTDADANDRANRYAVTGGASQALACLLQVFTDPIATETVWFVEPAYMLAFRIFEDSGLERGKFRGVKEDEEGLDVQELRRRLDAAETEIMKKKIATGKERRVLKPTRPWAKHYRHVIYAVPTFSNPSSKVMSLRRREELVRVAREYDALIITDDVYDQLQWTTPFNNSLVEKAIMPRLVDIDENLNGGTARLGADGFGNTASNGSFSKVCGPGLRTGWVEGTEKLVYGFSQAGSNRSGGAASQLIATFLAELLDQGLVQKHITQTLRPAYATRYHRLVSAIERDLVPLGVRLEQQYHHSNEEDRQGNGQTAVRGGYFLWLTLPRGINAAEVAKVALEEENLIVAQGEMFEVPRADGDNITTNTNNTNGGISESGVHFESNYSRNFRLCLAWEDVEYLDEGIVRLKQVIERLFYSQKSSLDLENGETATKTAKVNKNVLETFG